MRKQSYVNVILHLGASCRKLLGVLCFPSLSNKEKETDKHRQCHTSIRDELEMYFYLEKMWYVW